MCQTFHWVDCRDPLVIPGLLLYFIIFIAPFCNPWIKRRMPIMWVLWSVQTLAASVALHHLSSRFCKCAAVLEISSLSFPFVLLLMLQYPTMLCATIQKNLQRKLSLGVLFYALRVVFSIFAVYAILFPVQWGSVCVFFHIFYHVIKKIHGVQLNWKYKHKHEVHWIEEVSWEMSGTPTSCWLLTGTGLMSEGNLCSSTWQRI